MLKLIAIENGTPKNKEIRDKERYASIYKILKPGKRFCFYRGYAIKNGSIERPKKDIDCKFFSSSPIQIDISAIVGKNGCGKSSLIELYLRLMNNLAYVCHQAINDGTSFNTQFVDCVFSTAYFLDTDNGQCHAVSQYGAVLKYLIDGVEQFNYNYNMPIETPGFKRDKTPERKLARECLQNLFYTEVINYSAYSYNIHDYLPEWDTVYNNSNEIELTEEERLEERCWIDALFHKNDGYQLPIVLNPFRDDGVVDYNNESTLTLERLYSLTVMQNTPLKRILNNMNLDSFVFDTNVDLSPVGSKTYASKKVMSKMRDLRIINNVNDPGNYDIAENYGQAIMTVWNKCYGIDFFAIVPKENKEKQTPSRRELLRALNYVVYKTLKIAQTYSNYQVYSNLAEDNSKVEQLVRKLYEDNSHITKKIRQCFAFMIFQHYGDEKMKVEEFRERINNKLRNTKRIIASKQRKFPVGNRYSDVEDYLWKTEDLFPAPSFNVSMYLKGEDEKNSLIRLTSMSSGQRQLLYSVTTFAYHLKNIDSVWDRNNDDENRYKNVCVIFDEMDLYMHPDYQTILIELLIQVTEGLGLRHVKGLQIICASHSPFILSDIPRNNVLFLKDGEEYLTGKKMRTFAANIGDLLCDSFFMQNGLIGEYSKNRIISLVDWLEGKSVDDKGWTVEKAKAFVEIVDDPFVSTQLNQMLREYQNRQSEKHEENSN